MIILKGDKLILSGKDDKGVKKYAKEHNLSYRDVVYLALMNGIAAGYFNEKKK